MQILRRLNKIHLLLPISFETSFTHTSSSVGQANCQCGRGVWDVCRSFGLGHRVRWRLLRVRASVRSSTSANARRQPRHWNRGYWLHHCRDVGNWKWDNKLFRKYWSHRYHKGTFVILFTTCFIIKR